MGSRCTPGGAWEKAEKAKKEADTDAAALERGGVKLEAFQDFVMLHLDGPQLSLRVGNSQHGAEQRDWLAPLWAQAIRNAERSKDAEIAALKTALGELEHGLEVMRSRYDNCLTDPSVCIELGGFLAIARAALGPSREGEGERKP